MWASCHPQGMQGSPGSGRRNSGVVRALSAAQRGNMTVHPRTGVRGGGGQMQGWDRVLPREGAAVGTSPIGLHYRPLTAPADVEKLASRVRLYPLQAARGGPGRPTSILYPPVRLWAPGVLAGSVLHRAKCLPGFVIRLCSVVCRGHAASWPAGTPERFPDAPLLSGWQWGS